MLRVMDWIAVLLLRLVHRRTGTVRWQEEPPVQYSGNLASLKSEESTLRSWAEADVEAIKAWFASMDPRP